MQNEPREGGGFVGSPGSDDVMPDPGWWRNYDLSLRHGYSSAEEADFALNQCLYMQAMVESSEALQRPAPPAVLPLAPP